MGQIKKLIEFLKRLFTKKDKNNEPIIFDFKLPKNLDDISSNEVVGPKDGYKPLNYPLECSVNIKINKKNKERILNNRCCPLNRWVNIVVVSKKNLDRLQDYGFKKIKCEDGIFWKKRLYKKNILTGGILIDISQDKEFYNVKIFLDRVIKLPSVIYYLIKDGVIECI